VFVRNVMNVGFEFLTAVTEDTVILDVTPCSPVEIHDVS
jgi:hypothetical protein